LLVEVVLAALLPPQGEQQEATRNLHQLFLLAVAVVGAVELLLVLLVVLAVEVVDKVLGQRLLELEILHFVAHHKEIPVD
jgi:hypothetical protein